MEDLAHPLQLPWRNLRDIQTIATSGKRGRKPGDIKPFDSLKIQPLKEELHARGCFDTDKVIVPNRPGPSGTVQKTSTMSRSPGNN